ncbi:hypothetical protein TL16_g04872 [Triparma laevis f. inornata]|uniref:Uncharacterized protein n=1 Tax=Triparma laevis f. inornata TaxID=1714386 RepID=A0A9W7A8Z6_9STRA|nr:hypothetical protein TL16_g04872 [Triparma laevis f. inornata]
MPSPLRMFTFAFFVVVITLIFLTMSREEKMFEILIARFSDKFIGESFSGGDAVRFEGGNDDFDNNNISNNDNNDNNDEDNDNGDEQLPPPPDTVNNPNDSNDTPPPSSSSSPYVPTSSQITTIKSHYSTLQPLRGVSYLYNLTSHLLYLPPHSPISNKITISSINEKNTPCPQITLWVRLHGPSIITGLASLNKNLPRNECTWSFSFPVPEEGEYKVIVKVQSLNPKNIDINRSQCMRKSNKHYIGKPISLLSSPGTFYSSWEGCCDICTRSLSCRYWTSREGFEVKSPRCLFYEDIEGEEEVEGLKGKEKIYSGTKREEDAAIHLGCGWDYSKENEETWCKDFGRDDIVYDLSEEKVIKYVGSTIENIPPTCKSNDLRITYGRWLKTSRSEIGCEPPIPEKGDKGFYRTIHSNVEPEYCWIHDTPERLGKLCNKASGCLRSPLKNSWMSEVGKSEFEYVWKPYECDLKYYKDEEIKECWEEKGFSRPSVKGDSIAFFFEYYVNNRFDVIPINYGNKKITITNLGLTHLIWHDSFSDFKEKIVKDNLNKGNKYSNLKLKEEEIKVWLLGPYIVSERESGCTSERMEEFAEILRPEIEGNNWKEVDWRNISMGLSHEMATQLDGMHVVGPAMKVAFHVFVNSVCGEE